MVDVIIVAILVCIIGGILFYLYRAKKRGEVCIGCPYGRQCTGHCGDMAKRPNTRRNIDPLTGRGCAPWGRIPSPQKGGTAMGTENIILLVLVVVVVAIGLWSTVRHFRGKGRRLLRRRRITSPGKEAVPCGRNKRPSRWEACTASTAKSGSKKPSTTSKARAGKVDLKKGLLTVSYAESLDDEQVKQKVERAGLPPDSTR